MEGSATAMHVRTSTEVDDIVAELLAVEVCCNCPEGDSSACDTCTTLFEILDDEGVGFGVGHYGLTT